MTLPRFCLLLAAAVAAIATSDEPRCDAGLNDLKKRLAALKDYKPSDRVESPRFPFDADTARQYQRAWADRLGLPLEWKDDLGMTFVLIPPGTFRMGSPND